MFLMHEPCAMALLRKTFVVITGLEGRLFCHNIFTIYCTNKIIISHHHQQPLQNHKKLYPIQFDIWPILRMAQIFQLDPPGHIGRAPTFYRNHKISMESSVQVHCMSSSMHRKSFLWDYLRSIVCTCSPFKRPLWNIAPFLLDHLSLDRCIPTYIISGAAQLLYHGYCCTAPVLLHPYIYY